MSLLNCELLDLRAFVAIYELRSFQQAADSLNLSQPAISRRIQKLEEVTGGPLFERTTRTIKTTALGQELLPLVRRTLEELDTSLLVLRDVGRQRRVILNIASIPTAASYFLPPVIDAFKRLHPNVRVRIYDVPAVEGIELVARGTAEFGLNIIGIEEAGLTFDRLIDDPLVLACRQDHPLAKREQVRWRELVGYPIIAVHRASSNRTLLDAALARHDIDLNWMYEVGHLNTALGLVEAGLGISAVPKMAILSNNLVARPLIEPEVAREMGLVRRRGGKLTPAAASLYDLLMATWPPNLEGR
ncbi:MAG: LysR family transcriptional regulator [Asticcacaulis sp.]